MGQSGIAWIDAIYDRYVLLLYDLAAWLGVSYEEATVWAFCIALPLALTGSLGINLVLLGRRGTNRAAEDTRQSAAPRETAG